MKRLAKLPGAERLLSIAASDLVWKIALGWFGVQSAWLALTVRYPQAFDEQFHFGLIKLHATQWWPFFSHEPPGAEQYGSVISDPSMLYHYVMSFPYRLIAAVTDSMTAQIICLRLMSVVMALVALYIFRKALALLPLSRWAANTLIVFVTLLPVFPMLAAHISYDNLALVASAALLYYTLRLIRSIGSSATEYWLLVPILLIGGYGSMVKYAYLPIFAAVVIFLVFTLWPQRMAALKGFWLWLRGLPRWALTSYGIALLIMIGMLGGVYGNNLVRYHNIIPRCDKVLSGEECSHYPPWQRDHISAQDKQPTSLSKDVQYVGTWYNQNIYETFFTIFSKYDDDGVTVLYFVSKPIPILYAAAQVMVAISGIVLLLRLRKIWSIPVLRLCLLVAGLYIAALFGQDMRGFLHSGNPVAIHGRYFLLIIVPLMACVFYGLGDIVRQWVKPARIRAQIQGALLIAITLLFTQGGGAATYIVRSNDDWYWLQSQPAQHANATIKGVLRDVTFE